MSQPRNNRNPTYALGTLVWVKLLKRVWWPGTVVDTHTTPTELLNHIKEVEPISCVVKFNGDEEEEEEKYHVVELYEEVHPYSCDRKMQFLKKGFSLYQNQLKGFSVIGNLNMKNFINEVIAMERLIGGDIHIFTHLKEDKEKYKSCVKGLFTPENTKKSKKKEVERKSLPAPKLTITPKTHNQPKPKSTTPIGFSCHSQVGCNFTTKSYDNLKRHMATHKKDTGEVTTQKSSNGSTSNKRKSIKAKPSAVKKQKLQEELLKDWDNDGEDEDEDEEINTNGVQSSSNFAQSSNEEVLQTTNQSSNNSDANILTEDDNVVLGESDLSECGSLNKTASLYKDIKVDTTNDVGIPLVESMSTEAEDSAIVEENTNDKEIVSNDKEVNPLNGTTIDKNMPIENLCSVDSTSNKIDCEDDSKKLMDDIPKDPGWESTKSAAKDSYSVNSEEPMNIPAVVNIDELQMERNPLPQLSGFRSGIQDTRSDYIFGETFDVFIPRSELGLYAEENELTVDNAELLRTALLNLIARLNMND